MTTIICGYAGVTHISIGVTAAVVVVVGVNIRAAIIVIIFVSGVNMDGLFDVRIIGIIVTVIVHVFNVRERAHDAHSPRFTVD